MRQGAAQAGSTVSATLEKISTPEEHPTYHRCQFVPMITIFTFSRSIQHIIGDVLVPMITIFTFLMPRTTKYTAGYQHLVDAYGVNSYREV